MNSLLLYVFHFILFYSKIRNKLKDQLYKEIEPVKFIALHRFPQNEVIGMSTKPGINSAICKAEMDLLLYTTVSNYKAFLYWIASFKWSRLSLIQRIYFLRLIREFYTYFKYFDIFEHEYHNGKRKKIS